MRCRNAGIVRRLRDLGFRLGPGLPLGRLRTVHRSDEVGIMNESDRTVGAGLQHAQPFERELVSLLQGMPYLEDEAVDLACSFEVADAAFAQQTAQHTVVPLEKLGENHALVGVLDDESAHLRDDQPLLRPEILRYDRNQHGGT